MKRLRSKNSTRNKRNKFGILSHTETKNAVFANENLLEGSLLEQKNRNTFFLCFLDYSNDFDKVRDNVLFQTLAHLNTRGNDLRLVRGAVLETNRSNKMSKKRQRTQ